MPATHLTVLDLFHEQVRRAPDAVAIRYNERMVTYRELESAADRLVHRLVQADVTPHALVAIALPRSIDLLVGIIGILKAGAGYLPLDPRHPASRVSYILDDANVSAVVTTRKIGEALPQRINSLYLDDPEAMHAGGDGDRAWRGLPRYLGSAAAAYVIYTSGSTGKPKGIVVSHGALCAFAKAASEQGWLVAGRRVLALTTVAFDISILELLIPLCYGCEVILVPEKSCLDSEKLRDLIASSKPHVVQATPSHWDAILAHRTERLELPNILVGGEALSRELAAELLAAGGTVWNLYGPTEATIWASTHIVRDEDVDEQAPHTISIGRPLSGYRMYVLDGNLQAVEPGVTGELFIAGAGLAREYWRRPSLTAGRFMADPFGPEGQRMYRTGDLGRCRADGLLEFVGRNDHQVKIRGCRIELGEIEASLRRHADVREAVAILHGDGRRIVSYVVRRGKGAAGARSYIADWQQFWDLAYKRSDWSIVDDFNLAGWESSYTSAPMEAAEMHSWIEQTVAHLQSLAPRKVLEIGCGTGLLLTRLAAGCYGYIGLDFSRQALEYLQQYLSTRHDLEHVTLRSGFADDLSFLGESAVDVVVLNSVAQYFPNIDYFYAVLREALRVTKNGGHIFVGDVRNLLLLDVFHTSVQLARADDEVSREVLIERIREATQRDKELSIDPGLFEHLWRDWERIKSVEILLKRGPFDNELTQFRYDVVLGVDHRKVAIGEPRRWIAWDAEGNWRGELESVLRRDPNNGIGMSGILNRRLVKLIEAVALLENANSKVSTAGELRAACAGASGHDVDELDEVARHLGVSCAIRQLKRDGTYDVVFNAQPETVAARPRPAPASAAQFGSVPSRRAFSTIGAVLQEYLRGLLPDYMVPSSIVELDRLPLTPNGKVDRAALPAATFVSHGTYRPPHTPDQEVLCSLFAELLNLERVGIDDNFFELGGHSLVAMRLAARARETFGLDLSMQRLFQAPTVAELVASFREESVDRDRLKRVVSLRERGTLHPLFCLPPVYGLSFAYAGLARELDPERPIYCLQMQGVGRGESFALTIEEAADQSVGIIRGIQASGPYHLFGWSFGGLLAQTVACNLQRQSEEVELLAVIDAYPRAASLPLPQWSIAAYLQEIREHVREAMHHASEEQIARLLRLTLNNARLMTTFRPHKYDGDMLLIAAGEDKNLYDLWDPYVSGQVAVHEVACRHMDMMTLEFLGSVGRLLETFVTHRASAMNVTALP